jgi:hypothetical protein
MSEEKPKTEQPHEEKNPADTMAEKRESRIVDKTAEFLGKALIITGAQKAGLYT